MNIIIDLLLFLMASAMPLFLCYWIYWEIKHAIREAKEDQENS
jgi:hypothetical protein